MMDKIKSLVTGLGEVEIAGTKVPVFFLALGAVVAVALFMRSRGAGVSRDTTMSGRNAQMDEGFGRVTSSVGDARDYLEQVAQNQTDSLFTRLSEIETALAGQAQSQGGALSSAIANLQALFSGQLQDTYNSLSQQQATGLNALELSTAQAYGSLQGQLTQSSESFLSSLVNLVGQVNLGFANQQADISELAGSVNTQAITNSGLFASIQSYISNLTAQLANLSNQVNNPTAPVVNPTPPAPTPTPTPVVVNPPTPVSCPPGSHPIPGNIYQCALD